MLCAAELIVGETGTVVSGKWLDPFGIGGLTLRIGISPVSYRLRNSTCNAAAGVTSDTSGCSLLQRMPEYNLGICKLQLAQKFWCSYSQSHSQYFHPGPINRQLIQPSADRVSGKNPLPARPFPASPAPIRPFPYFISPGYQIADLAISSITSIN